MSENGKHNYECMFILDARTAKKDYENLHTELTGILTKHGVEVAASHAWGERRLAYEIRRQKKGFYVLMHVHADPQALPELKRDLRLYEPLLRQLFLRIETIPETFEFPADPEERRDFRRDGRDDRRGGGDSRRPYSRREGDGESREAPARSEDRDAGPKKEGENKEVDAGSEGEPKEAPPEPAPAEASEGDEVGAGSAPPPPVGEATATAPADSESAGSETEPKPEPKPE